MNVTKHIKNAIEEYKNKGYEFWRVDYNGVFGQIPGQGNADSMMAISWENKKVVISK